ncbi:MAG: MmcQ/YjbR family DNA-binding protein [Thermoleophilia bacterium]|nr:MmcQ/YjbR family DNA-binding protein [Thermoleophilia bacterium]MDH4340652.1 MmcQ/YjbR family DNA-binding protein [Thermoleophilia bacterium]
MARVSCAHVDSVRRDLLAFALSLPEVVEDHPWAETVVKVGKKIFVFLGGEASASRVTVKLVESHGHALSIEGALPSGYGLGKAGWVTVPSDDEDVDLTLLCDWVEESYRIVAPKRLVALLDAASG